ncbi:hypothetical protein [Lacticaseibacillus zhaodongensis]|uniref:hypothetical protein n=1 Tax=Lacticaseibacillus zhaodongensis TaxID=2668065 RepID=UPI0012D2E104|nr:hypothetical protein [Lacticaseibacillus zhaodongensis]
MDESSAWLVAEAKKRATAADDYAQQAFYTALAAFCQEQGRQIELAEGEIDGRSWNHEQW